jgi:5-formyltetrahydrofolate cyclo-ligase
MALNSDSDWPAIKSWRRQQRADLIAKRTSVPSAQLRQWSAAITDCIEAGFPLLSRMTIGFCWPFKSEFDARFVIRHFRDRGATAALPAVVEKAGPLQFRKWWPGAPMTPGVYDIPVPDGTELVVPDAAIVPMIGFDAQGYRLGYGGGYFDRTLGVADPRPLAIGVAFELGRLQTISPQPHDIAMDFVVTEAGLHALVEGSLTRVEPDACRAHAERICDERGLPRARRVENNAYSSPVCYASEFPGYFGEPDKKQD